MTKLEDIIEIEKRTHDAEIDYYTWYLKRADAYTKAIEGMSRFELTQFNKAYNTKCKELGYRTYSRQTFNEWKHISIGNQTVPYLEYKGGKNSYLNYLRQIEKEKAIKQKEESLTIRESERSEVATSLPTEDQAKKQSPLSEELQKQWEVYQKKQKEKEEENKRKQEAYHRAHAEQMYEQFKGAFSGLVDMEPTKPKTKEEAYLALGKILYAYNDKEFTKGILDKFKNQLHPDKATGNEALFKVISNIASLL